MFDHDHRSPVFRIPLAEPLQTEFSVKLDHDQAVTIRMLAAKAEVTPQEIIQALAVAHPFSAAVSLTTAAWMTTCPETRREIPADVTRTRDEWFENVLAHIGLLKGDALQRYLQAGIDRYA